MILCKLSQVLVHIEDDGDRDDKDDGIDVCADKFSDDIPIQSRNEAQWVDICQNPFMVALFILSVTFTDVLQVLCFAKAVYK